MESIACRNEYLGIPCDLKNKLYTHEKSVDLTVPYLDTLVAQVIISGKTHLSWIPHRPGDVAWMLTSTALVLFLTLDLLSSMVA